MRHAVALFSTCDVVKVRAGADRCSSNMRFAHGLTTCIINQNPKHKREEAILWKWRNKADVHTKCDFYSTHYYKAVVRLQYINAMLRFSILERNVLSCFSSSSSCKLLAA